MFMLHPALNSDNLVGQREICGLTFFEDNSKAG